MSELTPQHTRVRDLFSDWADTGRADRMGASHEPNARLAFDKLALEPHERFLDVGCGVGYAVRWAAQLSPTIDALGVDLSPAMIDRACALSTELPNARFREALVPGPWMDEEGPFDAIFTMEAIYYLDDPDAALAALVAHMSPEGRLACVIDYYEENPASASWPVDLEVKMQRRSMREWSEAFERAGLTMKERRQLKEALEPGELPTWKHTHGSLLLLATR